MAVRRVDLGVTDVAPVVQQRLNQFPAAFGRKTPVGREAHEQEFASRAGQRLAQISAIAARRIEVIQCTGDQQIGVGIEIFGKLVALMAQITLDLKLHILCRISEINAVTQLAPELLVHHVIAQVRDVTDHAGDAQAALGYHAMRVKIPAVKIRIGHDGPARHFVEGNILGRQIGRAGHHDSVAHPARVLQGPGKRLHPTQRSAHHGRQACDAQRIEQTDLRIDPILNRHHRKIRSIDPPGIGIDVHRSGRTKTGAQVVDPDHKETLGVKRLARADHVVPPAFRIFLAGIDARHVMRGIECVTNQDRV